MLSGVGAAEELKEHGIPVLHDLPAVGKNLQDHLDITLMNAASSRQPIGVALSFPPRAVAGLFSYIFRRKGFLTSNVAESGGFVKSTPERDRPNLQFHFLPTYLNDHGRKITYGYGFTLHICDLLPKSRGRIGLKSPDPLDDPLIDPKYLDDPEDMKTMIAGVKIGRRIFDAPAWLFIPGARFCPVPRFRAMTKSPPISASGPRRSITRSEPAGWAPIRRRWSIRSFGCAVSRGCG